MLVRVSKRWILCSRRSTYRAYMFTGTVSTCRIHVDLHTLAVSIVSKKEGKNFSLKLVEGSEV